MIVVDSNVLAARILTSEATELALLVEGADNVWLVPCLWRYEFLNILATQMKAGRIKPAAAHKLWQGLVDLLGENESDPPADLVLQLVAEHHVTAYDAHFVALAQMRASRLVTEDAELLRKFPDLAISMKAFVCSKDDSGWARESPADYSARSGQTSRKPRTRKRKLAT